MGKPDREEWAIEHRAQKENQKKRKYRINQFRKAVRNEKADFTVVSYATDGAWKAIIELTNKTSLNELIQYAAVLQHIAEKHYGPELEERAKNARTE